MEYETTRVLGLIIAYGLVMALNCYLAKKLDWPIWGAVTSTVLVMWIATLVYLIAFIVNKIAPMPTDKSANHG